MKPDRRRQRSFLGGFLPNIPPPCHDTLGNSARHTRHLKPRFRGPVTPAEIQVAMTPCRSGLPPSVLRTVRQRSDSPHHRTAPLRVLLSGAPSNLARDRMAVLPPAAVVPSLEDIEARFTKLLARCRARCTSTPRRESRATGRTEDQEPGPNGVLTSSARLRAGQR